MYAGDELYDDEITSGPPDESYWPDNCERCEEPRTCAEADIFGDLCARCAGMAD